VRFDVYRMPDIDYPFAVDVQADLMSHLDSRIVIPVQRRTKFGQIISVIHPVIDIEGEPCVLATHALGSVPRRFLTRPVTSLAEHRDQITRALDLLFTGF
jgi:toxin CcdB